MPPPRPWPATAGGPFLANEVLPWSEGPAAAGRPEAEADRLVVNDGGIEDRDGAAWAVDVAAAAAGVAAVAAVAAIVELDAAGGAGVVARAAGAGGCC